MGFLDKRRDAKAKRQEDEARRQLEVARRRATAAVETWRQGEATLLELLEDAHEFDGVTEDVDLILKKGERAFAAINGAGLIEPRRLPGSWQGRSSGYSFHVAKGVNYRIGASRGTYKQGDETPQLIDDGVVTITNQRVVFQGTKASREWHYSKLLGFQHVDLDGPTCWTALQVSNRQKVSGFLYTDAIAQLIHFRLALGIARFNDDVDTLVAGITEQLEVHRAQRPPDPVVEPIAIEAPPPPIL